MCRPHNGLGFGPKDGDGVYFLIPEGRVPKEVLGYDGTFRDEIETAVEKITMVVGGNGSDSARPVVSVG